MSSKHFAGLDSANLQAVVIKKRLRKTQVKNMTDDGDVYEGTPVLD